MFGNWMVFMEVRGNSEKIIFVFFKIEKLILRKQISIDTRETISPKQPVDL